MGVFLNDVSQTQVGLPEAPNYIAGNSQTGVSIIGLDATGNFVQANFIGLGPKGQGYNSSNQTDATNPFPVGVYIQDSSANVIGGTGNGEGNTITGNNVGVYILGKSGTARNNQILGNRIGLNDKGGVLEGQSAVRCHALQRTFQQRPSVGSRGQPDLGQRDRQPP